MISKRETERDLLIYKNHLLVWTGADCFQSVCFSMLEGAEVELLPLSVNEYLDFQQIRIDAITELNNMIADLERDLKLFEQL